MCIEMFGKNLEPVKTVIPYRGLKLWFTVTFLRWAIGRETWGHGIGRHTNDEVWDIAVKDLNALSSYLGEHCTLLIVLNINKIIILINGVDVNLQRHNLSSSSSS